MAAWAEASAVSAAPAKAVAALPETVSFFSPKTRLWQGRSQMIFFQVTQPVTEDRYYPFQVDEKVVHLLTPPRVLKGETIGYLRVTAVTTGKSRIGVAEAKLDLEIVPDTALAGIAELNPQIVAPASGANVWGNFEVGVEQLALGDPADLPIPSLRLPNGKVIAGHVVPDQKPGPHARWAYEVSSSDLTPGPNTIVAITKDSSGHEASSSPLTVKAVTPVAGSMFTGQCPDYVAGDRTANDGGGSPKVVNDDKYGQGMVVDNGDEGRSWCLPVWIKDKGQYQMLVTARGDFGGDALPSAGLLVDEEGQPQTAGRLATTEWERMPVGHPIVLNPGGHILSVRIRNGFNEGPEDVRNFFIQKYELARVDGLTGGAPMAKAAPTATSTMMMAAATNGGPASDEVKVAFTDNIEGQAVTGTVDVNGQCWWPDRDHSPPPQVELYVNKKLVATQRSGNPRFMIDPTAFALGNNTLQMRAVLASGEWSESVPFGLAVPPEFPMPKRAFQPTIDFTTYNSTLNKSIDPPEHQDNPDLATLYSNGESTVTIPDDVAGNYRIAVMARGDAYDGPPLMSVAVTSAGKEDKLGEFPVGTKMGLVSAGQVVLAPGPKTLKVGFTNDKCDPGKGDRNLYVGSVELLPVDGTPDKSPPRVFIAFAPKQTAANGVDAVVARAMDDQRVARADLLIDDQPQHLDQTPFRGFGSMVFPLLTRDLKPGRHYLKVVARDDAGNVGSSEALAFTVSPTPSPVLSKYQRALFLLNRFGYGAEPAEVAAILTMGETNWLASRLAQETGSAVEQNEVTRLRAQFPNLRDGGAVTSSAIEYLLTEANPVRARFVMWTENHFSTWMNKDGSSAKGREHESFVELGPVPFFDLLFTSATSPAMLVYLDQRYSYAHRLNENYAREIMELHTLGVKGGYTQKDVTTLADVLTGWSLADEAPPDGSGGDMERYFTFDPHLNHGTACRVFGVEFPGVEPENRFDRELMALEMLTGHPSCATFISRKLCEQYAADPAPPKLVSDLAQVYLETGGDVSAMLVAMSQHPDFWSSPGKVASPIDFAVRSARMARSTNPGPVNDLISTSGMGMFDRATPDGYPEDDGYNVNSNALLQRWRFAKSIQNDFLGEGLIPDAWRPADSGWTADVTQRIVDLAAMRMTGNVLSEASNDAAQKLLAGAPPNTDIRLHALTTFICQLPENSLK